MTPLRYAKEQITAGRFPAITIQEICGEFYLGDRNWDLLAGGSFKNRAGAERARSRILDKAQKAEAAQ